MSPVFLQIVLKKRLCNTNCGRDNHEVTNAFGFGWCYPIPSGDGGVKNFHGDVEDPTNGPQPPGLDQTSKIESAKDGSPKRLECRTFEKDSSESVRTRCKKYFPVLSCIDRRKK